MHRPACSSFPLKDFYFDKTVRVYNNNIRKGNYNNILVLAVVTIALLIIGLFNFINIYTVMMLKRAREFGVKKVYGAGAKDVFAQISLKTYPDRHGSMHILVHYRNNRWHDGTCAPDTANLQYGI